MSTSIEAQPYIPNMEAAIAPMPFEDQLQPTPEAPATTLDRIKDFGRTAIDRFNTLTDHLPTPSRKLTALATTGAIALGVSAIEATPAHALKTSDKVKPSDFDPTKYGFQSGAFDYGLSNNLIRDCAQEAVISNYSATVRYTSPKHNKVKISLLNSFYEAYPWCQLGGDLTLWARNRAPNKSGKLSPNSRWGIENVRPGQMRASVVLPVFRSHKCAWGVEVKSSFQPVKGNRKSAPKPIVRIENDLVDTKKCSLIEKKK